MGCARFAGTQRYAVETVVKTNAGLQRCRQYVPEDP